MTDHPGSIQLWMIYDDLSTYPHLPLPPGLSLRSYVPGDAEAWCRIWNHADHTDRYTPAIFHDQFGHDPQVLQHRILFLKDPTGSPVATAAAWFIDEPGQRSWGRVHWIAVDPSHQGRGLARPLLSACCRRMHELGHPHCQLSTDSFRAAPIHFYLRCGFRPDVRTAEQDRVWHDILSTFPAATSVVCCYDRYPRVPTK